MRILGANGSYMSLAGASERSACSRLEVELEFERGGAEPNGLARPAYNLAPSTLLRTVSLIISAKFHAWTS